MELTLALDEVRRTQQGGLRRGTPVLVVNKSSMEKRRDEGRGTRDEGRGTRDEGRGTRDERRDEGRGYRV